MSSTDIHVCGKCHSVFQYVEMFLEHREEGCSNDPVFRDSVSLRKKPMLWPSEILLIISERDKTESLGLSAVESRSTWRRQRTEH